MREPEDRRVGYGEYRPYLEALREAFVVCGTGADPCGSGATCARLTPPSQPPCAVGGGHRKPWTDFTGSGGQPPYPASIPLPAAAGNGRVRSGCCARLVASAAFPNPKSSTSGGKPSSRDREPVSAVKVVADAGDVPDEHPG